MIIVESVRRRQSQHKNTGERRKYFVQNPIPAYQHAYGYIYISLRSLSNQQLGEKLQQMCLWNRLGFVFTSLRFSLSGIFFQLFCIFIIMMNRVFMQRKFQFYFRTKILFQHISLFFFVSFSFNQSFVGQPRRALRLRHGCLNSIHFMRRFNSIIKYFAQFVLAGILFSLRQSDVGFHFILSCTHLHIFSFI